MNSVNLLPEDYVAWRRQKRASFLCAALFALVMIGVVAGAIISQRAYGHTRGVRDRVSRSYEDAQQLITQVQQLERKRAQMLKKAVLTASLQESVLRSYLLAAVTESLPAGASMIKFKLEAKRTTILRAESSNTRYGRAMAKSGSTQSGSTTLDTTITVTGLAGTDVEVAKFIAAMARNELIDEVELIYSEEKTKDKAIVREFQVAMRLKPGAQLVPPATPTADVPGRLATAEKPSGETR